MKQQFLCLFVSFASLFLFTQLFTEQLLYSLSGFDSRTKTYQEDALLAFLKEQFPESQPLRVVRQNSAVLLHIEKLPSRTPNGDDMIKLTMKTASGESLSVVAFFDSENNNSVSITPFSESVFETWKNDFNSGIFEKTGQNLKSIRQPELLKKTTIRPLKRKITLHVEGLVLNGIQGVDPKVQMKLDAYKEFFKSIIPGSEPSFVMLERNQPNPDVRIAQHKNGLGPDILLFSPYKNSRKKPFNLINHLQVKIYLKSPLEDGKITEKYFFYVDQADEGLIKGWADEYFKK